MSLSWPLRGTSRETHTITGLSPSPWRRRILEPSTSGLKCSVSIPKVSCSSRVSTPATGSSRR